MEHENLVGNFVAIVKEMNDMHDAHEVDMENPSTRFVQLVTDGYRIKKEIDPLLIALFCNRPRELADWNDVSKAFETLARVRKQENCKTDSTPIEQG